MLKSPLSGDRIQYGKAPSCVRRAGPSEALKEMAVGGVFVMSSRRFVTLATRAENSLRFYTRELRAKPLAQTQKIFCPNPVSTQ
jgi:hypothetical protein